MAYYDDWLLPELAGDILRIAFTDESGKMTPKDKIDAFRILQSKYSKHLKFGTTLSEDYHPIIVKHLQEAVQKNRILIMPLLILPRRSGLLLTTVHMPR